MFSYLLNYIYILSYMIQRHARIISPCCSVVYLIDKNFRTLHLDIKIIPTLIEGNYFIKIDEESKYLK